MILGLWGALHLCLIIDQQMNCNANRKDEDELVDAYSELVIGDAFLVLV